MPHIKKSYLATTNAIDFLPLTFDIAAAIKEAAAENGVVHVVVPKGGAGLLVFENLAEVREGVVDFLSSLERDAEVKDRLNRMSPLGPRLQSAILQRSLALPVVDGSITLAPYEEVILVDCEKRSQRREVIIAVVPDAGKAAS